MSTAESVISRDVLAVIDPMTRGQMGRFLHEALNEGDQTCYAVLPSHLL